MNRGRGYNRELIKLLGKKPYFLFPEGDLFFFLLFPGIHFPLSCQSLPCLALTVFCDALPTDPVPVCSLFFTLSPLFFEFVAA